MTKLKQILGISLKDEVKNDYTKDTLWEYQNKKKNMKKAREVSLK